MADGRSDWVDKLYGEIYPHLLPAAMSPGAEPTDGYYLQYEASTDSVVWVASPDTTLTTEEVQDIVGAMVSGNTETLITVTYQDGDGTIDFVVNEAGIDHDNLTNTHNLTTDIDHDTLTNTHNLTTDIDHDTITNTGGNKHIDWTSASAGTIDPTNYTDNDTQLTTEQVQDIVGGMVTGNTETGITVTYQDADGTIDFASSGVSSGDTFTSEIYFSWCAFHWVGTAGYVPNNNYGWYSNALNSNDYDGYVDIPIRALASDGTTRVILTSLVQEVYTSNNAGRAYCYIYTKTSGNWSQYGYTNPAAGGTGWRTLTWNFSDLTLSTDKWIKIRCVYGATSSSAYKAFAGIKLIYTEVI